MGVLDVAVGLVVVVAGLLSVASVAIVGRTRLEATAKSLRPRLRAAARPLLVLVAVLLVNGFVRDAGVTLSWLVGLNVTSYIFKLEGQFVAVVQSVASPPLTAYFSAVYIYGYAFLLTFPLVAYLTLPDPEPLRETAVAYTVNYGVGLLCYVLFIAYGPRNFMPDLVDPLLYSTWPDAQFLTREVNRNVNVFPSLHSSLSATVAIMAYRTREEFPRWVPVAGVLAASVAVSTMYLGIHWATDVVAGVLLGALSVAVAQRI